MTGGLQVNVKYVPWSVLEGFKTLQRRRGDLFKVALSKAPENSFNTIQAPCNLLHGAWMVRQHGGRVGMKSIQIILIDLIHRSSLPSAGSEEGDDAERAHLAALDGSHLLNRSPHQEAQDAGSRGGAADPLSIRLLEHSRTFWGVLDLHRQDRAEGIPSGSFSGSGGRT